jgi:hypothetical protein
MVERGRAHGYPHLARARLGQSGFLDPQDLRTAELAEHRRFHQIRPPPFCT